MVHFCHFKAQHCESQFKGQSVFQHFSLLVPQWEESIKYLICSNVIYWIHNSCNELHWLLTHSDTRPGLNLYRPHKIRIVHICQHHKAYLNMIWHHPCYSSSVVMSLSFSSSVDAGSNKRVLRASDIIRQTHHRTASPEFWTSSTTGDIRAIGKGAGRCYHAGCRE